MTLAYRREIDGLRAIAVSSVVLFHAGVIPSTAGYVGVDIFFVISGYLITALLLREQESVGRIDLVAFYARRVRRIFPAVAVVILATIGVGGLLLDFRRLIPLMDSAIASLLFVSNLYFEKSTGGYFQESAETLPLLHLWSLSVEEQYYLVWPILLIGLLSFRVKILPVMVLLAVASLGLSEWLMLSRPESAFYQMPARFWELAVGGMVAALPARKLPNWVIPLGLLLVLDAVLVPADHFPGFGAILVVGSTALILTAIHGGATFGPLASTPLVGIGLISYSLYLWHWPLLAFFRIVFGSMDTLQERLVFCGMALLFAFGSFRYLEQPLRRRGSNRSAIFAGVGTFALLAFGAFALGWQESRSAQAIASRDKPPNADKCHNVEAPSEDCASDPEPPTVAIWGDSMAWALQPLASELARQKGSSAINFSMDGCKPAMGYVHPTRPNCLPWNVNVLSRARRMDTVILVGRWGWEFFDVNREAAESGMRSTLEALRGTRRVIVIGPTPVLRAEAPQCLGGNDMAMCAVSHAGFLRESNADRESLQLLVGAFSNAEYVEVSDWLCRDQQCPATRDGMILYYDNFHISTTAAKAIARDFDLLSVK